jgi:hypothetical protein
MLHVLLDEVDIANLFLFHRPDAVTRLFGRNYAEVVERLASECRDRDKAEEAVALSLYQLLKRVGPLAKADAPRKNKKSDTPRKNKVEEAVVTLFDLLDRVGFDPSVVTDEETCKRLNVDSQFRSWLVTESRFRLGDRYNPPPHPRPLQDDDDYVARVERAVDIHYRCFHKKFWHTPVCNIDKARRVVALHIWGDHCCDYYREYCKDVPRSFNDLPHGVQRLERADETSFVQALLKRVNPWSPNPATSVFFHDRAYPKQYALKMTAVAEAIGLNIPMVSNVVNAYRQSVIDDAKGE